MVCTQGGGKSFGLGLWYGITGVFVQPVKGATTEGAWGLVKGTGKGLVGLVVKPTVGVLDLAASMLNALSHVDRIGEVSQHRTTSFPLSLYRIPLSHANNSLV